MSPIWTGCRFILLAQLSNSSLTAFSIPGIPPTGKKLEIPFTAVVNIRGDRLYHEHIAWDQATVLVQLGLMPEYLPYPYSHPTLSNQTPERRLQYRVPVAGVETANKLRDKDAHESNHMFSFAIREVRSDVEGLDEFNISMADKCEAVVMVGRE